MQDAPESLTVFDYTNDGVFDQADVDRLQTIVTNLEPCPS
jgi:hypothetical protein